MSQVKNYPVQFWYEVHWRQSKHSQMKVPARPTCVRVQIQIHRDMRQLNKEWFKDGPSPGTLRVGGFLRTAKYTKDLWMSRNKMCVGVIHLARTNLASRIVAHEHLHAVCRVMEAAKLRRMHDDHEEWACLLLGEMMRRFEFCLAKYAPGIREPAERKVIAMAKKKGSKKKMTGSKKC